MPLASPHLLETVVLVLALACALSVRPWRLLAYGSPYQLLTPLLLLGVALPLLWWWPGVQLSPLLCLVGVSLALLTLGWPLAVLLLALTAGWGVLAGVASWGTAISTAVWHGILPLTLGLVAGFLLRSAGWTHFFVYLLGRGFLVPLAAGFLSSMAAHQAMDRFISLGSHPTPALFLTALLDAMLTGMAITLLVIHRPQWLATWSERIYLRGHPRAAGEPLAAAGLAAGPESPPQPAPVAGRNARSASPAPAPE
jgi:uncharacterized membrane protein